ncbi:hypothetical protein CXG81DRAFT_18271 [Caulochytrium protostelioides]|uniref:Cilia- and flagella-associated protein 58 central coiled coil domain-containing protein n=1 Tax=Caulochytrium protostelioides TaxID=1555241 RepID=A0A4V1ITT3_9FUNG|nr:hypothetical protein CAUPRSCDRAFT_10213 [Caulochytrium protostelioides]RKP01978.1 hypothetical protein CXG81DRAFT_18271 [Caulochytrium protostelioides]|eukprot:RKP01978.1 hypothetical protein CXG81DRAFT_18271 [Caulochytrium protostelioides]
MAEADLAVAGIPQSNAGSISLNDGSLSADPPAIAVASADASTAGLNRLPTMSSMTCPHDSSVLALVDTFELHDPTHDVIPQELRQQFAFHMDRYTQARQLIRDELIHIRGDADLSQELKDFLPELCKLYRALMRSKAQSQKMYKEFGELSLTYRENAESCDQTRDKSAADQEQIAQLQQHIGAVRAEIERLATEDEAAKKQLRQYRYDITHLNEQIAKGVHLSTEQEKAFSILIRNKESLTRDRDAELERVNEARMTLTELSDRIRFADKDKRKVDAQIYDIKDQMGQAKMQLENENRTKERLDQELKELRGIVNGKNADVRSKMDFVERAKADIAQMEAHIASQKGLVEKIMAEQDVLTARIAKLKVLSREQTKLTTELVQRNYASQRDLDLRRSDLMRLRQEVKKVKKIKEALQKRNAVLEQDRQVSELQRKIIREKLDKVLKEIDEMKQRIDTPRKMVEDLARERKVVSRSLERSVSQAERQQAILLSLRQTHGTMTVDIDRSHQALQVLEERIRMTEHERDVAVNYIAQLQQRCVEHVKEIKEKEHEIFLNKKRRMHTEAKLQHQVNLYQAVQSDRNLHCKHLLESQAEIAAMKRKLKAMNFRINACKDEITMCEQTIARDRLEQARLKREAEINAEEIAKLQTQNSMANTYMRSQQTEEVKLDSFVKEAVIEQQRQETAIQALIRQRDELAIQIQKQSEEMVETHRMLQLQQASLLSDERYYGSKLAEIQAVKADVLRLRCSEIELTEKKSQIMITRHGLRRLDRELMQERIQAKALEGELQFRVNIHSWRKLESANPKVFSLLQLLHTLQRKILQRHHDAQESERAIREQEKVYIALRAWTTQSLGQKTAEHLSQLTQTLQEKQMQLTNADAALRLYKAQIREHDYHIELLDRQLTGVEQAFLAQWRGRLDEYLQQKRESHRGISRSSRHPTCSTPAHEHLSAHLNGAGISSSNAARIVELTDAEAEAEAELQAQLEKDFRAESARLTPQKMREGPDEDAVAQSATVLHTENVSAAGNIETKSMDGLAARESTVISRSELNVDSETVPHGSTGSAATAELDTEVEPAAKTNEADDARVVQLPPLPKLPESSQS